MPAGYRNSATGNTLYDERRFASVNVMPGQFSASSMGLFINSMTNGSFFNFQGNAEGSHGLVYTGIGGNMHDIHMAGTDPLPLAASYQYIPEMDVGQLLRIPHPVISNKQIKKTSFREVMRETKTTKFNFSLSTMSFSAKKHPPGAGGKE